MKQNLNRFLAFVMALLVLWAGNGYGVLEHSCEEHGKHHHLLSHWVHTSCEHEHHHDSAVEEHEHTDSGFDVFHSEGQVNFVYLEAETLLKTSVELPSFIPIFQANLLPSFVFQTLTFSSEIHSSVFHIPLFRRTFGRSLLAFVQSFLI
ncbi:MAG: hypothetical protein U0X91_25745 [Spirosomataceae bacterium]